MLADVSYCLETIINVNVQLAILVKIVNKKMSAMLKILAFAAHAATIKVATKGLDVFVQSDILGLVANG